MTLDFDPLNPIRSVDGKAIYTPSSYVYKLEDVSAPDAGRTEDGKMHKLRVGQLVGLEVSWKGITTEAGSFILKAFQPEYIMVCFLDLLSGGYRTSEFYVGNRSAPCYNTRLNIWESLSFKIIERDDNY